MNKVEYFSNTYNVSKRGRNLGNFTFLKSQSDLEQNHLGNYLHNNSKNLFH